MHHQRVASDQLPQPRQSRRGLACRSTGAVQGEKRKGHMRGGEEGGRREQTGWAGRRGGPDLIASIRLTWVDLQVTP